MELYDILFAKSLAGNGGGGGGSSNFVTGTFKGTEAGVKTLNIPYNGEGYIVSIAIAPAEGAYNSNGDFYKLIQQYAINMMYCSKCLPESEPTYTGAYDSRMGQMWTYKSSGSSATQYSRSSNEASQVFSKGLEPSGSSNSEAIKIPDQKQIKVYIGTSYGFAKDIDYRYVVEFSE